MLIREVGELDRRRIGSNGLLFLLVELLLVEEEEVVFGLVKVSLSDEAVGLELVFEFELVEEEGVLLFAVDLLMVSNFGYKDFLIEPKSLKPEAEVEMTLIPFAISI